MNDYVIISRCILGSREAYREDIIWKDVHLYHQRYIYIKCILQFQCTKLQNRILNNPASQRLSKVHACGGGMLSWQRRRAYTHPVCMGRKDQLTFRCRLLEGPSAGAACYPASDRHPARTVTSAGVCAAVREWPDGRGEEGGSAEGMFVGEWEGWRVGGGQQSRLLIKTYQCSFLDGLMIGWVYRIVTRGEVSTAHIEPAAVGQGF